MAHHRRERGRYGQDGGDGGDGGVSNNDPDRPKRPDRPRPHERRSSTAKPSERERQPLSAPTCETKRSPPIKLKENSGTTSVETFFEQFRTSAEFYKWTDEDKGVWLRCQLTGDAANLLWTQPNANDVTYEELERMLRGRFGSEEQEEKFQTELRASRRGREESLQALHADITRLMALAYPKDDSPLSRVIARDYFLTVLGDPELDIKVREREPPDLQAAYKTATRLETLKTASSARRRDSWNAQGGHRTKQGHEGSSSVNGADESRQRCGGDTAANERLAHEEPA